MPFDFFRDPKSKAIDLAQKQISLAIRTVENLKNAMVAFSEGKTAELNERIETIFRDEMEIDELRRLVYEELAKSSLQSKDREILMHLVKRLDVMADHVKDSARSVKILIPTKIPKEIWDINVRIAETLVKGSVLLSAAIEMLGINAPQARELTKRVDKQENVVDEEYLKAKALFFTYTKELDFATTLILKDLLEYLEQIADTCADTADYIRVLTVGK